MKCRVHQNGCICLAKSGWGERQRHAPCSSLPILSVGFWPSVFIAWLFPTQCFLLLRQKMLMLRCANLSGTRFDRTSQSPKTCHDSSMHRRHAGQNYLFPNFSRALFPSPMMIKQVWHAARGCACKINARVQRKNIILFALRRCLQKKVTRTV